MRGKKWIQKPPNSFCRKSSKIFRKKITSYHRNHHSHPYKSYGARSGMLLQYLYETLVQFGVKFCFFFNTKTQLWGLVIFLITIPYIGWYQDILISLLQSLGPAYGLLHAMSYVLAQGLLMEIIFLPYFKVDCCVL